MQRKFLRLERKTPMKPLHLENHIFNLDTIVMIEPYKKYNDYGFVHCINGHAYQISKSEYKQLLELLEKE